MDEWLGFYLHQFLLIMLSMLVKNVKKSKESIIMDVGVEANCQCVCRSCRCAEKQCLFNQISAFDREYSQFFFYSNIQTFHPAVASFSHVSPSAQWSRIWEWYCYPELLHIKKLSTSKRIFECYVSAEKQAKVLTAVNHKIYDSRSGSAVMYLP